MVYTVYKTTNVVNGKFYIGVHKTLDPQDDYIGSGTILRRAIVKYGRDSFFKEVLEIFDFAADAFAYEAELVTEELVTSATCYNTKLGGVGGFDWINERDQTERNRKIAAKRDYQDPEYLKKLSESALRYNPSSFKHRPFNQYTATREKGWKQTEESKRRMSEGIGRAGGKGGSKNSQFGTMWITDGFRNTKIKKGESIPDGWRAGRTIKEYHATQLST